MAQNLSPKLHVLFFHALLPYPNALKRLLPLRVCVWCVCGGVRARRSQFQSVVRHHRVSGSLLVKTHFLVNANMVRITFRTYLNSNATARLDYYRWAIRQRGAKGNWETTLKQRCRDGDLQRIRLKSRESYARIIVGWRIEAMEEAYKGKTEITQKYRIHQVEMQNTESTVSEPTTHCDNPPTSLCSPLYDTI